MDERDYWLGLTLIQGIGTIRLKQLLTHIGSAASVWHATEAQLRSAGLPAGVCSDFLRQRHKIDLNKEIARIRGVGAMFLTLLDAEYPAALRTLDDAPAVLYMLGQLLPADDQALAVVGTRSATRYGRDAAYMLSQQLAAQRITIISGLAQGVDSAAHRGALEGGGRTIAVLGCGIERIYPAENKPLAEKIVQSGAILTEYRLGTPPNAANFPRRNRLLSGLARGVLVVEAPEHSGALITATTALEQGRDVFAVPGNIFSSSSRGTNKLIQDGAKLVMDAHDILAEVMPQVSRRQMQQQTRQLVPESPAEAAVLALLDADPLHVDDIIRMSGLGTGDVTAALTLLELKGLAQTTGPMQYCRSR